MQISQDFIEALGSYQGAGKGCRESAVAAQPSVVPAVEGHWHWTCLQSFLIGLVAGLQVRPETPPSYHSKQAVINYLQYHALEAATLRKEGHISMTDRDWDFSILVAVERIQ